MQIQKQIDIFLKIKKIQQTFPKASKNQQNKASFHDDRSLPIKSALNSKYSL